MKKNQVFPIFTLFLALMLLMPTTLASYGKYDIDYPELTAPNALLVDALHDEILYEKGAHDIVYPASTTKTMTALLVVEAIAEGKLSMNTMVTATEASQADLSIYGSTQGIVPEETMSVKDLLYCLMLASANEAGNILAIEVAGDLETFIDMMNAKALALGCANTQYMNTHGLHDDNHYTTAHDLYLIFKHALTLDDFAEMVGTATYTTQATNLSAERSFYNSNALLSEWYYKGYMYPHCIGGKTGSTPEAGLCLVSAAKREGEYVISVVLGAQIQTLEDGSTHRTQFAESGTLLAFGLDEFERRIITPTQDPVGKVDISLCDDLDHILLRAQGEIEHTLPISMDLEDMVMEVNIEIEAMEAPVAAGMKMGTMTVYYEEEEYGVFDVVTMTAAERSEILYRKQEMENFVGNYGLYLVGAVVVGGAAIGGVQYSLQQRRRRNSWRNNQRKRNTPSRPKSTNQGRPVRSATRNPNRKKRR